MEDEQRPLPQGWVRSYDQESHHQFFVNTNVDPPMSIWHHPYDDEEYLSTLPPAERANVTRLHHSVSLKDIAAESSDEEGHHGDKKPIRSGGGSDTAGPSGTTGASSSSADQPKGLHKFGRKLKDRVTSSTHEEREKDRAQRAEEEQKAYKAHQAYRQALSRAIETGEPQFLGKDKEGRDVYIESPNGPPPPSGPGGTNPYKSGPYANPNARFIQPADPYAGRMDPYGGGRLGGGYGGGGYGGGYGGGGYGGGMGPYGRGQYARPMGPYNRPMGYGYGGGYGFPLAGGLMGGMMLGGLLF